jgi:hypothetical protein
MGVSIPRGRAALIFRRHRKAGGRATFTDISGTISLEINTHCAKLFEFFQARPELSRQPLYRRALLAHLPRMIRKTRPSGCGSRACRPNIARPRDVPAPATRAVPTLTPLALAALALGTGLN